MDVKNIDERVSVECPACGIVSLNPKFLTPSRAKKSKEEEEPFWGKPASRIQNALWTEITLFNLVCKKCGCNFSLPVSEKPFKFDDQKEKSDEESSENGESEKKPEKKPEESDSESKGD